MLNLGIDLLWLMMVHDIYVLVAEQSYNLLEQRSILHQGLDLLCPMTGWCVYVYVAEINSQSSVLLEQERTLD